MPKKRLPAWHNYSKPQSSAPASLAESDRVRSRNAASSSTDPSSVNARLASLRLSAAPATTSTATATAPARPLNPQHLPNLPPELRQILEIPDLPAPPPRRRRLLDATGRRLPPGPPPPSSWVAGASARRTPAARRDPAGATPRATPLLPNAFVAHPRSLLAQTLAAIARAWDDYLPWAAELRIVQLPAHTRQALIAALDEVRGGVTMEDVRAILVPPLDEHGELDNAVNIGFTHLSVPVSLCRRLGALGNLLVVPKDQRKTHRVYDSWEEEAAMEASQRDLDAMLLPDLTHLSFALPPSTDMSASEQTALWKDLLVFSKKIPTITHLSLAHWPSPTPLLSQTGISDAVTTLRTISKYWYRLKYLDLVGCDAWLAALTMGRETVSESGEQRYWLSGVDWANDWGLVETVLLSRETRLASKIVGQDALVEPLNRLNMHIVRQRAGKGRMISVKTFGDEDFRTKQNM